MKLLLVSHTPTLIGGSERSLLEIAKYLHQQSIELVVSLPGEGDLEDALQEAGIKTEVFRYEWAMYNKTGKHLVNEELALAELIKIKEFMMKFKPDVVLTNTSVVPWFAYIADILDIPHLWFLREATKSNSQYPYYPDPASYLNFINSYADELIVNSESMKQYYRKALHRKDIFVVYPTISKTILNYTTEPESTIGDSTKLIVYGGISEEKNQLEALQAVRLLCKKTLDFHLTIMGQSSSKDYYKKLQDYVKEHDLASFVTFLDHQPDPYKIVAQQNICIVPSVFEPFGRVTVESMLLKKVVVASNSGGNVEVIQEGGNYGLLYSLGKPQELADRLEHLIKSPHHMREISNSAYEYALEKYIRNNSLEDLIKIIEKAAQKTKSPAAYHWLDELLIKAAYERVNLNSTLNAERLQYHHTMVELTDELKKRERILRDVENSTRWRLANLLARPIELLRDFIRK